MCYCKVFHSDGADLKLFHANFNQLFKKHLPKGVEKFIEIVFLYAHLYCVGWFFVFMYEEACMNTGTGIAYSFFLNSLTNKVSYLFLNSKLFVNKGPLRFNVYSLQSEKLFNFIVL